MANTKVEAAYQELETLAVAVEKLQTARSAERFAWVNRAREFAEKSSLEMNSALQEFRVQNPEPKEIPVPDEHRNPCLQLHPARARELIEVYQQILAEKRGRLSRSEVLYFFEEAEDIAVSA